MSSVTHFEICASEPRKLADFYRVLFGWQLEKGTGNRLRRLGIASEDCRSEDRLVRSS